MKKLIYGACVMIMISLTSLDVRSMNALRAKLENRVAEFSREEVKNLDFEKAYGYILDFDVMFRSHEYERIVPPNKGGRVTRQQMDDVLTTKGINVHNDTTNWNILLDLVGISDELNHESFMYNFASIKKVGVDTLKFIADQFDSLAQHGEFKACCQVNDRSHKIEYIILTAIKAAMERGELK
ncbi:hypothetical protein FACS189472_00720 [Alphaproteobacteria bacterium]|nr:hypothetical protein FACS189472_00720 [Alphaproteobacteria bacterium]